MPVRHGLDLDHPERGGVRLHIGRERLDTSTWRGFSGGRRTYGLDASGCQSSGSAPRFEFVADPVVAEVRRQV
jgi:hypothetical protein